MRKLVSNSKRKNKQRFYQILFGVILVLIMFSSVIGYGFVSRDSEQEGETLPYNGLQFKQINSYWLTNIGDYEFAFKYHPKEVPRIYSEISPVNVYYSKPLYVQSEDDIATAEIYTNLRYFVERMQRACLKENNETVCEGDLPPKDCTNNLIIIQTPESITSNETSIIQDNGCVFITAPKSDLVRVTDEFLFKTLGID